MDAAGAAESDAAESDAAESDADADPDGWIMAGTMQHTPCGVSGRVAKRACFMLQAVLWNRRTAG